MRKSIIICVAVFFSFALMGQQEIKMSRKNFHKEKEAILNTIINSPQFDSIHNLYSTSIPVFAENEILLKKSPIKLKYKNKKVRIINEEQKKECTYWCLGDFFLNIFIDDPRKSVVQLSLVLKNKKIKDIIDIGISLEKTEKEWIIEDFVIIE